MAADNKNSEILWQPWQRSGVTAMDSYRKHINERFGTSLQTTKDLQRWSVDNPHDFWLDLYSYLNLTPALPSAITKAYDDSLPMSSIPAFFSGLDFNYAENVLFANPNPDATALIAVREGQSGDQRFTWREFREQVRVVASALSRSGIGLGDRVAALVATSPWAVIVYHAAATIGAVFTSISPELGVEGCVSRLQQVTPKILFVDSHAFYNGKVMAMADKVSQISRTLQPQPEIFVIPLSSTINQEFPGMEEFLQRSEPSDPLSFTRVPFSHPLMICYSSGTTGAPKCIVHQHGSLIQYRKVGSLHNCVSTGDVVLSYSSTSWVVFYSLCGSLAVGATIVLYNGSPLFPDAKQLLRLCAKYGVSNFGASPRLLLEIEMSGTVPKLEFDLSRLKTVQTTGAPLLVEQYRWFYRSFPPSVQISNTAGGTETATAIIAMDPCAPIVAGEMQLLSLGMDVDIADPDTGESIAHTGEDGELIIRKPFPSMPCFFWGDTDGSLYKAAYFQRYTNLDVWAQHDLLRRNPRTGGYIMQGRSDGVLSKLSQPSIKMTCIFCRANRKRTDPSGIRFGSGEIYGVVETQQFSKYFSNCLCVGRRRPSDSDEKVFLFLVMQPGHHLTQELRASIKRAIREALSPRHVPSFVVAVPEIPMTINGKRVEVAVKKIISGKDVKASATVVNPLSLRWFERCRTLESEVMYDTRAKL